jgi:hypothetical protein
MVADSRLPLISFTGSTAVGRLERLLHPSFHYRAFSKTPVQLFTRYNAGQLEPPWASVSARPSSSWVSPRHATPALSIARAVAGRLHDVFPGGNNACIVMDDADLGMALRSCVFGAVSASILHRSLSSPDAVCNS